MTKVAVNEYQYACDNYRGWCTECGEFTRSSTEPDAEKYRCPDCGKDMVMSAEQAILLGEIVVG